MSKPKALLTGLRCLVLEDEFLIALDLQDILEQAGATVTCFANAEDAQAALVEGAAFDAAVLDVQLSGAARTSLSVAAALAAAKTPFIFLTGMRRDAAQAAAYPDAPMLEKPYQQDVLLETVRRMLA